jgi:hypothetical protein
VVRLPRRQGRRRPFGEGRAVSARGTSDLARNADGITGYTLINAQDIDEAEKIALSHPAVPNIQVFEALPM